MNESCILKSFVVVGFSLYSVAFGFPFSVVCFSDTRKGLRVLWGVGVVLYLSCFGVVVVVVACGVGRGVAWGWGYGRD